ncbi:unnamed protein product [Calicophoron daubneyi]|uniref:Serine aminopeptidase S33 domain-containing protein n=1 Tax=Calicophoron daubneyi TaxID=300641 RepID=A0AAV2TWW4_CALDB
MRIRRLLRHLRDWFSAPLRTSSGGYAYVRLTHSPLFGENSLLGRGWTHLRLFLLEDAPFYLALPASVFLMYLGTALSLPLSLVLLFLAIQFLFHLIENALVYARNEPVHSRLLCDIPTHHGFNSWEQVKLFPNGRRGPTVTGFLLLQEDAVVRSSCSTILILHGNAGNMGHRLPFCRLIADKIRCNLLIIDYRGFGKSTGRPTEDGLYEDAKAALDYLASRSEIAIDKIFVFGRSIGGAVAIQLGTGSVGSSLCGVIVENSFTSLPLAAHHIFTSSFGAWTKFFLPHWLFLNKFPSLVRLRSYQRLSTDRFLPPFLFISGSSDDLLSPTMMQELAAAYSNATECRSQDPSEFLTSGTDGLVCFAKGKHNDTWLCEGWSDVLAHFIEQSLKRSGESV